MNELDEVWENMMNEAIARARSSGRSDVADYLTLKASNDAVRAASVKWLFDATSEIAAEINRRRNAGISVENEHPYRFAFGNANLVGSLVRFRHGVRCLTVEAGWTRTPNDGFMRGGALACARISHFGIKQQNAELILLRLDNAPHWFAVDKDGKHSLFDSRNLQNHFQIFLGAV
jgi:hypothetical protein